ncbi:MAG: hypothetical protein WBX37_11625, partial [Pseudolabrys sp.]
MQQVIGIAEVDELFSFLVNRHKSDIPSIGVGRILNFPNARCGTNSTGTPSFFAIVDPNSTVTPRYLPVASSL